MVGADSAIGSALCKRLGAVGTTRRLPLWGHILFDLCRPAPLPPARITYFCGAITKFRACDENPELAHQINVEGTVRVARDQVDKGGRVVLLSSCAAETHPDTVYGSLKLETEAAFTKLGGSIFRFGPVMTPGRHCYPCMDYNPITVDELLVHLTAPFTPGIHRILNQ